MSAFVEELPGPVDDKVGRLLGRDERPLIQVATDMADQGRYGERWLVVTTDRVLALGPNSSTGEDVHLPLQLVKTAHIEPMVGGGRLGVERHEGEPVYLYYSNSLALKFAEVAEGISSLVEGEDPNLPLELDRTRCIKCDRLLPEPDGICPACIKKTDTLLRLLSYIMPYRMQALMLIGLTLVAALLGLAPPYIIKHIIDDVLTVGQAVDRLYFLVGLLFGISIIMWVSNVFRRWLNTWVGFRALEDLRADLYKALQLLPLRFHDKRKIGSLISRMNNDSDLVEAYLIFDAPFILSNAVMVVGICRVPSKMRLASQAEWD